MFTEKATSNKLLGVASSSSSDGAYFSFKNIPCKLCLLEKLGGGG